MLSFVLVLTLTLGGQHHDFVVDHGMTADDCAAAIAANPGAPLACRPE